MLPVIAIFGRLNLQLQSLGPVHPTETQALDCRCYANDDQLAQILVRDHPVVLVSFGEVTDYPKLLGAPFQVRKRWLHFPHSDNLAEIGHQVFYCFLHNALARHGELVSVFTPAYRTGNRILRPYHSLLAQDYKDWEWLILDDSGDEDQTFKMLTELAQHDHRIQVFKMHRHSGCIGQVKQQACRLAQGQILVELDHDDALTYDALGAVVRGFSQYPEAGFLYTYWAEVFEDGRNAIYPEGWAFGYGQCHEEVLGTRTLIVQEAPRINAKTIRHIVSAPNHIRAWRRDFYESIGGHNPEIHIADDYELCVRTFLHTRMILLPKLCYLQYYNQVGNTQRTRNQDIQRMTRYISQWYDRAIHERLVALGVDDFIWEPSQEICDWQKPNPVQESHCSLIVCV